MLKTKLAKRGNRSLFSLVNMEIFENKFSTFWLYRQKHKPNQILQSLIYIPFLIYQLSTGNIYPKGKTECVPIFVVT